MAVDLAVALRIMNHEVRTPASVLQGYLKMLTEGRIDDERRPAVLVQMQRAAARIALIGQESSDLLHWMSGVPAEFTEVPLSSIAARLESAVPEGVELGVVLQPKSGGETIQTCDEDALVTAVGSLVKAVARQHGSRVTAAFRPSGNGVGIDVCVFPSPAAGSPALVACSKNRLSLSLDHGGLGLSMFVAAAIVDAHGGALWQQQDGHMVGATFPWKEDA